MLARRPRISALLAAALIVGSSLIASAPASARDASTASEAASTFSLLPVASIAGVASVASAAGASVAAAPAVLLSSASQWLLVSAQVSADGALWILERASDGVRIAAQFTANRSADLRRLSRINAGHVLLITPVPSGWLIGADDVPLAFIPRSPDRSLFHHERIY